MQRIGPSRFGSLLLDKGTWPSRPVVWFPVLSSCLDWACLRLIWVCYVDVDVDTFYIWSRVPVLSSCWDWACIISDFSLLCWRWSFLYSYDRDFPCLDWTCIYLIFKPIMLMLMLTAFIYDRDFPCLNWACIYLISACYADVDRFYIWFPVFRLGLYMSDLRLFQNRCIFCATVIPVYMAIPMTMGANIGTTVTNTIVAMGQSGQRGDFRSVAVSVSAV